jgi:TonB-dependent receptor
VGFPGVPTNYEAGWEEFWSEVFPDQGHPVGEQFVDTDYTGQQEIKAWYYMVDVPVCSFLNIIGGVRYESTDLAIIPIPEAEVKWYPGGSITDLKPGDADVDYKQDDMLPSIGFVFKPFDQVTIRGSRSETVARQTFKELTPILQQEFLGGPVFIGNPGLKMSALKNYDLRLDYRPNPRGLISVSWFKKDVTNPIEYVQRVTDFSYTTPINYPEGELSGWEFEVRQDLGEYWEPLAGLTLGGNATIINSEVRLPKFEQEQFNDPNINAPMKTRDMLNAPEHLYNLFVTYNIPDTGTKLGLFYTVRGDTLIAGPGVKKANFIPAVYETEYGTLNFTLSQALGDHWKIKFSAKNLLDPKIQTVYRSDYITEDVVKTSYQKGMSFSLSIGAEW